MPQPLPVRTPSATELVALLSSRETTRIRRTLPLVVQMLRPRWWWRLLVLVVLTLLGVFVLFTGFAAWILADVARLALVQRQPPVFMAHPALPAAEHLLNPATFSAALARQSDQAGRLHLVRSTVLLAAGRNEEAVAAFAAAAATGGLPMAQRLRWAEALAEMGRHGEATVVLYGLSGVPLDDAQRVRTAGLAGRCLLAVR